MKQRWFARYLGVLEVLAVVMLGVAAVICHNTTLPERFDLQRAGGLVFTIITFRNFPAILAGAALLIQWRVIRELLQRFRRLQGQPVPWTAALRFFLCSAVPAGVLAGFLPGSSSMLDQLAIVLLATLLFFAAQRGALSLGRIVEVVEPFLLFVLMTYPYTVIKASLALRGGHLWDAELYAIDRLLFLGHDPLTVISGWFPLPRFRWLYILLDRVYYAWFLHFVLVFVVLVARGERLELRRYAGSILLSYYIGACAYHLFPALGPVYHFPRETSHLARLPLGSNGFHYFLWRNRLVVQQGRARMLYPFEYIACMPSLHVAAEFVMLFFSRRCRPLFVLTPPFFVLVLASTVMLGWHYAIDWFGGLAVAGCAIWLSFKLAPRLYAPWALRSSAEEQASPPASA